LWLNQIGYVQVLLCPPSDCQSTGCAGHRLVEKDVLACGVDTSNATAIGTTYQLTFVVRDRGGLNASVYRIIEVISPCDEGSQLCSDGICHSMDCSTVNNLKLIHGEVVNQADPVLVLLPSSFTNLTDLSTKKQLTSNQTVFTTYGQNAPFSLLPCAPGTALTSQVQCAAAAYQLLSNGSWSDVSEQVSVLDVSTNTSARYK
jgi:hypothetical protein